MPRGLPPITGAVTTLSFMANTETASKKDRTATAIRFPEDLHERLRVAAQERDFSINYLVVKAVDEFLGRLIPPTTLKLTRD